MTTLEIQIDDDLCSDLQTVAEDQGLPVSALAAAWIEQGLDRVDDELNEGQQ